MPCVPPRYWPTGTHYFATPKPRGNRSVVWPFCERIVALSLRGSGTADSLLSFRRCAALDRFSVTLSPHGVARHFAQDALPVSHVLQQMPSPREPAYARIYRWPRAQRLKCCERQSRRRIALTRNTPLRRVGSQSYVRAESIRSQKAQVVMGFVVAFGV